MSDEVALARCGDLKLAMKITVLQHFDAEVLSDSLGTRLQVNGVYGLQEVVESLSSDGVNGIVLVGGVEDHVELTIVESINQIQPGFKGHSNVDEHNVGAAISNGVVAYTSVGSLVNDADERTVTFDLAVQDFTGGRFIINDDGIELGIHWRTIWL